MPGTGAFADYGIILSAPFYYVSAFDDYVPTIQATAGSATLAQLDGYNSDGNFGNATYFNVVRQVLVQFALTFDGSTLEGFQNTAPVGSLNFASRSDSRKRIFLGSAQAQGLNWFYWNRVLSSAELAQLYAKPYGMILPPNSRRMAALPPRPPLPSQSSASATSGSSASSSGSGSSSSSSGFAQIVSPRPVVQWDGPFHPSYFKDYPFVETVAGGEKIGASVIPQSGAFTFRADLVNIPSIGGLSFRFGVNYLVTPLSEPRPSYQRPSILGPGFSYPQDAYIVDGAGTNPLTVCTGEFTAEPYVWQASSSSWIGQVSKSSITKTSTEYILTNSEGTVTRFYANPSLQGFGRIKSITDRYGNQQFYTWNDLHTDSGTVNRLVTVLDGYNRTINFNYDTSVFGGARVTSISDFMGRQINFQYDSFGRLEAVIGPSITAGSQDPSNPTSGTNTFPYGTAYVFRYDAKSGMIKWVFFPNEVQSTAPLSSRHVNTSLFDAPAMANKARYKVTYDDNNRVVTEEEGNAVGGVGGIYQYTAYESFVPPLGNSFDTSDPIYRKTFITDRNGNNTITSFNRAGLPVLKQVMQNRKKCSLEAAEYDTYTKYNAQGQPVLIQYPAGNSVQYGYDPGIVPGIPGVYVKMRGLLRSVAVYPGTRGGSNGQQVLQTVYAYEPIYNQLCAVIEPRGNPIDGSGTLWVAQNGSTSLDASERFATLFFYDYQKDSQDGIQNDATLQSLLNLDSADIGNLFGYVWNYMLGLGLTALPTGLPDINGDGVSNSHRGSRVLIQHAAVNNINAPDDVISSMERTEVFTVNYRGQVTTHTDPEGNLTVYTRYTFDKPDNQHSNGSGSTKQYGFLKSVVADADPTTVMTLVGSTGDLSSFTMKVNRNSPLDTQPNPGQYLALTTTITQYDQLANPTAVQNPRGLTTTTYRNELGEPYLIQPPSPYSYRRQIVYDANRNIVGELIDDYQPSLDSNKHFVPSVSGSGANVPSTVGAGGLLSGMFYNSFTYDLLDNRIREDIDATLNGSHILLTTFYQYDANQNLICVTKPAGNLVEYDYNERDLRIAQRVGRGGAEPGAATVWSYDLNGNLQNEIGPLQRGSASQALTAVISHAFGGIGSQGPFTGDYVRQIMYDGFDRALTVTDAVGGQVQNTYDPGGRVIIREVYGTAGGGTPADRAGSSNVLLAQDEAYFDEAGHPYESIRRVFLRTVGGHTVPSGRTITHTGGGLTHNSSEILNTGTFSLTAGGQSYVLSRTIFDRSGRVYQVMDDLVLGVDFTVHTIQYDGANRRIIEQDPLGNTMFYGYDANGNVIQTTRSEIGPAGSSTETFQTRAWYDVIDRLVISAHQGKDGSIVSQTALNGVTTLAQIYQNQYPTIFTITGYDSRNNSAVVIDPKQNTVESGFDGASRLITTKEWMYVNGDGSNGLVSNVSQQFIQTTRTLDGNGRLIQLQDANGNQTQFSYDNLDRQTLITFPNSNTRMFAYNEASDLAVYTDEANITFTTWNPGGGVTGVDVLGRVTYISIGGSIPSGSTTNQQFEYDGLSRRTYALDESGSGLSYLQLFYDSLGRIVEEEQLNSDDYEYRHVTHSEFLSYASTQCTYPEPSSRVVDTNVDALYRRTTVYDPGSSQTAAAWRFYGPTRLADARMGNGIYVTHLNNAQTNSAVQSGITPPGWGDACSDRLGYDGAGRLIGKRYQLTCGSSSSSVSSVSSFSSPMSSLYSSGAPQSSAMASSGGPISSGGPAGSSGTPPHNSNLYILCGTTPPGSSGGPGGSSGTGPGSSGGPQSSGGPSSGQPQSSGIPSSQSSGSQSSGSSSCLCVSPVVYCNLLTGFTADYDQASNKSYERHLHAECRSFLYTDPAMGQTSPISSYDSADRLLSFQRGLLASGGQSVSSHLSLPGVDYQRSYNLDALGNWVTGGWSGAGPAIQFSHDCAPDQENRTTNNLNQVASINGGGTAITYDLRGNVATYNGLTLTYDAFNRLYQVSGTGPDGQAVTATYRYDALGRRTYRSFTWTSSGTVLYYYDGQQVVEEQDGITQNPLRQYVWGQYIDELIQQREYQQPPSGGTYEDLYPLTDLLYRSVALSRQNPCGGSSSAGPGGSSSGPGEPFAEVYDTDVYGRTKIYNGSGRDGRWFTDDDRLTYSPICKYIFTGREYDPETGLYNFRARYYSPDLGRFLNRDPLLYGAGDSNLYEYVNGNPLAHGDPTGLHQYDPGMSDASKEKVDELHQSWRSPSFDPTINPVFHAPSRVDLRLASRMEHEAELRRQWHLGHDKDYKNANYWADQESSWHEYIYRHEQPRLGAIPQMLLWLNGEPGTIGGMVPVVGVFRSAVQRWDEVFYGHGTSYDRAWSALYGTGDVLFTAIELTGAPVAIRWMARGSWRLTGEVGILTKARRFFWDPRRWETVSRKYWKSRGGAGLHSLHHWLFPRKAKWVPQGLRNAGFNLLDLPPIVRTRFGGLNEWMGLSRSRWAPVIDWTIRIGIPGSLGGAVYIGGKLGRLLHRHESK